MEDLDASTHPPKYKQKYPMQPSESRILPAAQDAVVGQIHDGKPYMRKEV